MKIKYNCPLPKDPEAYSMDEKEIVAMDIVVKFQADVVEKQDQIIMSVIREIGGETYQHITIDKNKVIDALKKATPKKVVALDPDPFKIACPTCSRIYHSFGTPSYCRHCGQALDWNLERSDKDGEADEL